MRCTRACFLKTPSNNFFNTNNENLSQTTRKMGVDYILNASHEADEGVPKALIRGMTQEDGQSDLWGEAEALGAGAGPPNSTGADDDDGDDVDSIASDFDFDEEVERIYNSHIGGGTSGGYICYQIRLVLFLARGAKEKGSRKHRNVLSKSLREELEILDQKGAPLSEKRECIKAVLKKASKNYRPINVKGNNRLTPEIFVKFLLSISDTKNGEYKKGGGVSAKTFGKQSREQLRTVFAKTALNFDWIPAVEHIAIDWE